jgi:hypothetical protein
MPPKGRIEKRLEIRTPAFLLANDANHTSERVSTINISRHGAGVVTTQHWGQEEAVQLIFPAGDNRLLARVIYCHPEPEGTFRVGLQFKSDSLKWPGPKDI